MSSADRIITDTTEARPMTTTEATAAHVKEAVAAARLRVLDSAAVVTALDYAEEGKSPYDAAFDWLQATTDGGQPNLDRIAVAPDFGWADIDDELGADGEDGEGTTLTLVEGGYGTPEPDLYVERIEAHGDTDDDRLADLMAERLLTEILAEDDGTLSPEVRARITRARDSLLEGLNDEASGDTADDRDIDLPADSEAAWIEPTP